MTSTNIVYSRFHVLSGQYSVQKMPQISEGVGWREEEEGTD